MRRGAEGGRARLVRCLPVLPLLAAAFVLWGPSGPAAASTPPLVVSTVAGTGTGGFSGDGGPALSAELADPEDVAVDLQGNVVIVDSANERLRVLAEQTGTYYGQAMTAGDIYTVAGTGTEGYTGDGGPALAAEFDDPEDVVVDPTGNLVVADTGNSAVRVVAEATGTYYGLAMTAGDIYTVAHSGLAGVNGVAVDQAGNLVMADTLHQRIAVLAESTGTFYGLAMTAGTLYTVAGDGTRGYTGDGGPATSAELSTPVGVSVDQQGNLVVADTGSYVLRVVAGQSGTYYGQSMTEGDIYTVAGDGTGGDAGDGGPATSAWLASPSGVAVDGAGNLVFADDNNTVRVVADQTGTFYGVAMTAGDIYTVAGTGLMGYTDGFLATEDQFADPEMVAVNSAGDLFVADPGNARVREILPALYNVAVDAGNNQTAAGGTAFPTQLSVTVTSIATGLPVAGIPVKFTAPVLGALIPPTSYVEDSADQADGSLTETVVSNSNGVATADPFYAVSFWSLQNPTPFSLAATTFGGTGTTFTLSDTVPVSVTTTVEAGDNQTSPSGTPYATDLAVLVTNPQSGQPESGVQVDFYTYGYPTVCAFFTPGQQQGLDYSDGYGITNGAGIATAPQLTPNAACSSFGVDAGVFGGQGSAAAFSLDVDRLYMSAVGGASQSTLEGTSFPTPLTARVTDGSGNPQAGIPVIFSAPTSGATGTFPGNLTQVTVDTDASGDATAPTFTANAVTGTYDVTATSPDAGPTVSFVLTNEGPDTVTVVSGSPQTTPEAGVFLVPFTAEVTDTLTGLPVAGASVTFAAPTDGPSGTFPGDQLQATVVTDAGGVAVAPTFTADNQPGYYPVTAVVTGQSVPADFNLVNEPQVELLSTAGTPQSTGVGTAFATDLTVKAVDYSGDPLPNMGITFSAPASGATGTFPGGTSSVTVLTDASGIAAAPTFTADGTSGAYQVTAQDGGTGGFNETDFYLTNLGPPASFVATAGTPQYAVVGQAFATALSAQVTDAAGDPLSGLPVTFSAPPSGATGTFSGGVSSVTVNTDGQGRVVAPTLTADGTIGSYQVTATLPGFATPVVYDLANQNTPAEVTAVAGTPQSTVRGYAFPTGLGALVTDAHGNPLVGITVIFSVPVSGVTGTFPNSASTVSVLTSTDGVATAPTLVANGAVGSYQATATVTGVATPADFSLTNTVGADLAVTESAQRAKSGKVKLLLNLRDLGPDTATSVAVTDVIVSPDLSTVTVSKACAVVAPPPGANAEVTCEKSTLHPVRGALNATISLVGTAGGSIVSTVQATSALPDPNPANNTVTVTTSYR